MDSFESLPLVGLRGILTGRGNEVNTSGKSGRSNQMSSNQGVALHRASDTSGQYVAQTALSAVSPTASRRRSRQQKRVSSSNRSPSATRAFSQVGNLRNSRLPACAT